MEHVKCLGKMRLGIFSFMEKKAENVIVSSFVFQNWMENIQRAMATEEKQQLIN